MKKVLFTMLTLVLMVGLALPMALPAAANGGPTKDYGDLTINQWQSGNFPDIWDLTKCDLTLSYTIDMSAIATAGWSITEVGLREVGGPNIDPNYQGGFLLSKYASSASNDNLAELNDLHVLMIHGWLDEYYDREGAFPGSPMSQTATWAYHNYAFWFDRDGVDATQATYWNYKDGITYNTEGVYDVEIQYHANSATEGVMYVTINEEAQGFYTQGYESANPPETMPIGRTFAGDMTRMQVFYGRGGGGGTVDLNDIEVDGCFATVLCAGQNIPVGTVGVWNDEDTLYVRYVTDGDWMLAETHLAVETSEGDIPQNKKGNPIPGHFEYSMEHDPLVQEYTYEIPLGDWGPCTDLVIAAHAVVVDTESCPGRVIAIERGTAGDVYEIDMGDGSSDLLGKITAGKPPASNLNSNNGFAFDYVNGRLYYAANAEGNLYFFDVVGKTTTLAGTLQGEPSNASYYQGAYYYISQCTDDLHAVALDNSSGLKTGETITADIAGSEPGFSFGDIAITTDGFVYGAMRYCGEPAYYRFFTFDLSNPAGTYVELADYDVQRPQLALGGNGELYGCATSDGQFYSIDKTNGALTDTFTSLLFNDLASGWLCEPTTETAWGDGCGGTRFVTKGNWGTYFTYEVQPPCPFPLVGNTEDISWGLRETCPIAYPNDAPVTFTGTVDASGLQNNGAVFIGLVDKDYIDGGDSGWMGGAYAYFGRIGNNLRVGPTDGNLGGEIVQVFKTYTDYFSAPTDVDFTMVIYDGSITITLELVDYVDTYGEIKALNSTTAYAWDEFEYGAYIAVDTWPYDPYGVNDVSYDVLIDWCNE